MAQDSHTPKSTDELIAEISRNREALIVHRAGLHRAAQVGDRLQHSFHDHAGLYLGAAAALGMALALIPSSKKSRHDKRALRQPVAVREPAKRNESRSLAAVAFGLVAKLALEMGKPMLLRMVKDHYAAALHSQPPSASASAQRDTPVP